MGYNVLFYTSFKANPTKGGTERTTISTASGLKQYYGCKCYSIYTVEDGSAKADCFEDVIQADFDKLDNVVADTIEKYSIDVFINQGEFSLYAQMGQKIKKNGVTYVMAHHFQPGWDENFFTKKTLKDRIQSETGAGKIKDIVKLCAYTFYFRPRYLNQLKYNYKAAYEFADRTVLLASGFIDEYADYAGISDKSKFAVIPNSLSYSNPYDIEEYDQKGKSVLIVSRMDDPPKKISDALRIWKEAKKHSEASGWSLDLVGDGPDLERYKNIVELEKIKDVDFWGRQVPDQYYRKASIFMMTSKSEGWGLTLTEAQQFAVVPIVYDTVAPFREIIENDVNGVLVEQGNQGKYVQELLSLMKEENKRKQLAISAYRSCEKFSQENIARKWIELMETVR